MNIDEAFEKYTEHKITKHGHEIKCKKGLFSVLGPCRDRTLAEARHYFHQYFSDGEYTSNEPPKKFDRFYGGDPDLNK